MSDNSIVVNLRCQEISERPVMSIIIDLDKVDDADNVIIEMSRQQLAEMGDIATWEST